MKNRIVAWTRFLCPGFYVIRAESPGHKKRVQATIVMLIALCLTTTTYAKNKKRKHTSHHTVKHHIVKYKPNTQTISLSSLPDFDHYPPEVKELVKKALSLAGSHLRYRYGSSNPSNGGMDCSGTIYYLLHHASDVEPPRQADEMYDWIHDAGNLHEITDNHLDFDKLKPGDLLFWSGTYHTNRKISHVMLYLGKNKQQQPLMFGASNGRSYSSHRINGVSVFDFKLPRESEKAKFKGYGSIPF